MNRFFTFIFFILCILVALGCGKNKVESKSMDTLYKEAGVPVTVQSIQPGAFQSECIFHSTLSGVEETTVSAMVSDKVEAILFTVGDRVNKDDIVMHFPIDNPATPYFQTKTSFEHAGATLARIKNLYESGGISLQEYENTKAQYETVKASWDAVQRAVRVKAPISGFITSIDVRKSDPVKPGDPLFTIADTRSLRAEVWVTEDQVASVAKGVAATATWRDVTITGKVVQMDASLNPDHQAFGTVMEFANPGGRMKNGVNAEIKVAGRSSGQSLVINRKNVRIEGDSHVRVRSRGQPGGKTSGDARAQI